MNEMKKAFISMFENAFDFKGRATRSEYWYVVLVNFIIGFILGFMSGLFEDNMIGKLADILTIIYQIVIIIPVISLTVRRLHDANISGFVYLAYYIYYILVVIVDVFYVLAVIGGSFAGITIGTIFIILLNILLIVYCITLLVFLCTDSKPENKWGPNKKNVTTETNVETENKDIY